MIHLAMLAAAAALCAVSAERLDGQEGADASPAFAAPASVTDLGDGDAQSSPCFASRAKYGRNDRIIVRLTRLYEDYPAILTLLNVDGQTIDRLEVPPSPSTRAKVKFTGVSCGGAPHEVSGTYGEYRCHTVRVRGTCG